jgi:hypothetical protein
MGRMIDAWSAPPVVGIWMAIGAVITLVVTIFAREMRRV